MAFENLKRKIRDRAEAGLDAIGVEMVDDVREAISVPVEYLDSGYVVRSDAGENPRREFGHLSESMGHDVVPGTDAPRLDLWNSAFYAKRLNFGDGGKLKPRPFFALAKERWRPRIGPILLDYIMGRR